MLLTEVWVAIELFVACRWSRSPWRIPLTAVRGVRTGKLEKITHRFAAHDDKSAAVRQAPWEEHCIVSPDEVRMTRRAFSIPSHYCDVYLKWNHQDEQVIISLCIGLKSYTSWEKCSSMCTPIFVNNALLSGTSPVLPVLLSGTSPVLPVLLSGTSPVLPALPGWTAVLTRWHLSRVQCFFFFLHIRGHAGREQWNAHKKRAGMASFASSLNVWISCPRN